MAGDWIKMRVNLRSHPKVVRMSSALKADRLRVIGGLHSAWCLFDEHSIDGRLEGYRPETLDEDIGFPGFSAAMIAVEWLSDDGDSLMTPRFDEHNGQSAKRRAQDSERKRNYRKLSAETSALEADKKRTREEKRREDKEQAPASPLPDWIPVDSWKAYLAMRKQIKKPLTVDGFPLAIKKLENLKSGGHPPQLVLEQSVMNSWQGLFEIKSGAAVVPQEKPKWD